MVPQDAPSVEKRKARAWSALANPLWWLAAWVLLSALLYALLGVPGARGWIELLNGATWPHPLGDEIVSAAPARRVAFATLLAVRTLLNLTGAGLVLFGLYWFLFGGKFNAMVKSVTNVRTVDRAALRIYLVSFLAQHQGEPIDEKLLEAFKQHFNEFQHTEIARTLDRDLMQAVADAQVAG